MRVLHLVTSRGTARPHVDVPKAVLPFLGIEVYGYWSEGGEAPDLKEVLECPISGAFFRELHTTALGHASPPESSEPWKRVLRCKEGFSLSQLIDASAYRVHADPDGLFAPTVFYEYVY